MTGVFTVEEVAKHNTVESCWVILYGNVYDVTLFLPHHPGGSKIILNLAGRDATEEYGPIHPEGTLDELPAEAKLGRVDEISSSSSTSSTSSSSTTQNALNPGPPPLESILNMNEMEEVATAQMSRRAWCYYFSAADDLISKNFNNMVYSAILLRPRMFIDCSRWDISTSLLGNAVGLPLYVSPAAMARLGHPDGEAGIARACSRFGAMQILSQNASMTPEQVVADAKPGQVFGWQLYVQNDRSKSESMLSRINSMRDSFKFIVLTLDAAVPGKRELDEKQQFVNASTITAAVGSSSDDGDADKGGKRPGGGGGVGQQLFFGTACDLTWEATLPWLAKHTDLPIVLKGIQTHEDAYLAAKYAPQVQGIILSNHGGRALDTAPPAIHTLLEIRKYCPEVLNQVEVWVDGGVKRGTDVVKALCLGARGVGIGRAVLYGLGAGGQKGVERVFEILKGEMEACMRLLGVEKVNELGPRFVNARAVEQNIYDGPSNLDTGLWTARSKL